MTQHDFLEEGLGKIRWYLQHPIRAEDPECCLFSISQIVQRCIGDRPGIPPEEEP